MKSNTLPYYQKSKNCTKCILYDFIIPSINDKSKYYIGKAISVSANGNVFAGCSKSYKDVDAEPMFNVAECSGNFLDRVIKWSRQYPVNEKINRFRELYKAIQWCREHDIAVKDVTESELRLFNGIFDAAQAQEKAVQIVQDGYSNIYDYELDLLGTAMVVKSMFHENAHIEIIKAYLNSCSILEKHCFRGQAQDIDIDTKYIDSLLNQTEIIGSLFFTGGEHTFV